MRRFHQTPNDERRPLDEKKSPEQTSPPEPRLSAQPKQAPNVDEQKEEVVDNIARVPAEDLPSHRDAQRWDLSKRVAELMDEVLPKLAVVTQKVNTYTGTDYSGIEALRREIKDQEKLVRARRAAIEKAKQALDAAHAQQASSQKEVVALLERKHSWSATDLERYMALIRSEHVNDQAVREAKEAVVTAESALEEARSQLERRERAQYHEEQIWSDTIRRNSTWVTFALMGFNIFLLLASLVVIEPWRRRRMVGEIKTALEAQKSALPAEALKAIEEEIDRVVVPNFAATELPQVPEVDLPTTSASPLGAPHSQEPLGDTAEPAAPAATVLTSDQVTPQEAIDIEEAIPETWQDKVVFVARDIFSERIISMRRIDYTKAVLQSAVAGAVIATAMIALGVRRPSS